jgi:hypothetical protein
MARRGASTTGATGAAVRSHRLLARATSSPAAPYDLRHSFASLLIHERRLSIVAIAHQLGHNPNVCLSTYAHVMSELDDARGTSAEDQIRSARETLRGPKLAQETGPEVLAVEESADFQQALYRTRTDDPFLTMEVLYQLS